MSYVVCLIFLHFGRPITVAKLATFSLKSSSSRSVFYKLVHAVKS